MSEWQELQSDCNNCKKCNLYKNRRQVVFGRGNKQADLLFIGEGPGENEDISGEPFVGAAGTLLTSLFRGLSIQENDYYITNIVKCRPPGNRIPLDEEAELCLPYLRKQVMLIKPKIIVCLGSTAMKYIVDRHSKISMIRGKWIEKKAFSIMPTFHPAALLRDESKKVLLWEDIKQVRYRLEKIRSGES